MDLSNVRLAAFDMDGTLLNRNSQMTEATKEACRLLQSSGCKLVLSTGRTYASALIPVDHFPFDGYVCSNGAAIHEMDGSLIKSSPLPVDIVIDAVHKIRQKPIYYELHDTESNRWMIRDDRERIETLLDDDTSLEGLSLRRFSFYKLARLVELEELLDKIKSNEAKIVKLFIWHRDPEQLQWVSEQLAAWSEVATITSSGELNVEVIAKGVSKWQGLRYFCEKWNLTAEQVAAFGDADNDLDILTNVGVSVAMENATPGIKAISKYAAKHHDEDGVASFIMEQILGRS